MIRQLSNGYKNERGYHIGLVDERSEIAAMYKGIPQNDIGVRTDVMNLCLKSVGMQMLIRSMGPEIIATDEIGGVEEGEAIKKAIYSGVKLLLTAHGEKLSDIAPKWLEEKIFHNIVCLKKQGEPGKLDKLWILEGDKYVNCV